jgi:hypothetical protein
LRLDRQENDSGLQFGRQPLDLGHDGDAASLDIVQVPRRRIHHEHILASDAAVEPTAQQRPAHLAAAHQQKRARQDDILIAHRKSSGLSDRLQHGGFHRLMGLLTAPQRELEGRVETLAFTDRGFEQILKLLGDDSIRAA